VKDLEAEPVGLQFLLHLLERDGHIPVDEGGGERIENLARKIAHRGVADFLEEGRMDRPHIDQIVFKNGCRRRAGSLPSLLGFANGASQDSAQAEAEQSGLCAHWLAFMTRGMIL
jgi:hypothetical protein